MSKKNVITKGPVKAIIDRRMLYGMFGAWGFKKTREELLRQRMLHFETLDSILLDLYDDWQSLYIDRLRKRTA
jgi:hypothetical protein